MDYTEQHIIDGGTELHTVMGLFSLEIVDRRPAALFIDEEFRQMMGFDLSLDPAQLKSEMFKNVFRQDRETVLKAIENCISGLKAEARFRWQHPMGEVFDISCIGVHAEESEAGYFVRGYFKLNTEDDTADEEYDTVILRNMLAEAMMDNLSLCALCDLENNKIRLVKDMFNVGKVLGKSYTYDIWRDTFSALVAREDCDKFNEATVRRTLMQYFYKATDERLEEIRCLDPRTRSYKWVRLRIVRFKGDFASQYKEMLVLRDITENRHTEFKDALRIKLINGLILPYEDIDLVNLKTGKWYSSNTHAGEYAETFDMRGFYDDEVTRYVYFCECEEEKRAEMLDKFRVECMRKRFSDGEKIIETEVRRKNFVTGQHEWVRIQAFASSFDEDGEPLMALVTIQAINAEKERQIKEQQMLEYALRAEQQYKQAILSSAFAVYTFNVSTDVLYDEVIETEGIDPLVPEVGLSCPCSYNEYIRLKSKYITSGEEAEIFEKTYCTETLLDMFKSNRRSFDTEYEFLMNGRKGVYREAVILTKDLQTDEVWGLAYVKNVTTEREENKRIEQAIRDAFYQAQRANSAKTLFMSQMSHDIRTPLNSILGMAQIAKEHIDDPARVRDCMEKIEYSGRHLLEIINNVLDLSAIESGKTVLSEDDFDMQSFLDDTIKIVKPLAEKRGHELICDIRPMHSCVKGDATKLRQLLTNILGNAVKYTPDGGLIRFKAEEIEPDRQDIARYMFTVEDNGVGMTSEFVEKVFDPFVRADDKRITKVEGTGLGMSIALNIARMMNGNITVKSEVGKGSLFEITVCLKRGEEHISDRFAEISMDEPKKLRLSDYNFGGKRILLAEDLQFNAEIASEFLSQAGLVTEIAENGAKAVEMFSKSPEGYYSLIFMDIQMPELDGHEATRRIRALSRPDAADIPIIAMTANAFVDDVKKAKKAGMNSHIAKPLEISRLIAELTTWLKE